MAIFGVLNGRIDGLITYGKTLNFVAIPETIDGETIISIGDSAFNGCSNLTSVGIGNGVTSICNSAFEDCYKFSEVYYKGMESEWMNRDIRSPNTELTSATQYYFIQNETNVPMDGGNYWHYDENGEIVVWTI